jgi:hypothetical protein
MSILVEMPCKVGQTIYYHFQFTNKSILPFVRKAKVKKIYCSNNKMEFVVDAELIDAKEKGIMKAFYFDDFGKTVFLNEKEAERALKGGAEGIFDSYEVTDELFSALEKQIPKKALEFEYPWAVCPVCGSSVYLESVQDYIMEQETTYCEHCGQALDWRDEE